MYVSIHHENKACTYKHRHAHARTQAASTWTFPKYASLILCACVCMCTCKCLCGEQTSSKNLWATYWLTHLHYKSQLHSIICLPACSDGILIRCPAEERHKFLINCSADLCTALTYILQLISALHSFLKNLIRLYYTYLTVFQKPQTRPCPPAYLCWTEYACTKTRYNAVLRRKMWSEMLCYQSGTICRCLLYEE